MTPFGKHLKKLREQKGITQAALARALDVSPAYLSALEHGRKGAPPAALVQNAIQYFELIWDAAQELQDLAQASRPRVVIDTAGMAPCYTSMANRFARILPQLDAPALDYLEGELDRLRGETRARKRGGE